MFIYIYIYTFIIYLFRYVLSEITFRILVGLMGLDVLSNTFWNLL